MVRYYWVTKNHIIFFKKNFEDINPFCEATDTCVLDFWWCLLCISKQEWVALFTLGRGICVTHSLTFISGATPADLLAASIAAKPSSSTYLLAGIGGTQNQELSCHHSQCENRQARCSTDWAITAWHITF